MKRLFEHWWKRIAAVPEGNTRIKPSDLRSECMKCGGDGRAWESVSIPANYIIPAEQTVRRFKGPCSVCSGSGRVFPRKIDV